MGLLYPVIACPVALIRPALGAMISVIRDSESVHPCPARWTLTAQVSVPVMTRVEVAPLCFIAIRAVADAAD